MASFINQLGKGFVRAAVNQVGREVGRQYYKTQQSPPQQYFVNQPGTPYDGPSDNNGIPNNAEVRPIPFSASKIAILIVVCIFLNMPGSVVVFIYGLSLFFDAHAKYIWHEQVPQFVSDRRYSSGVRMAGTALVKRQLSFQATPELKAINKRNGKIAMIIAGISIAIWAVAFSNLKSSEPKTATEPTAIEQPVDSLTQESPAAQTPNNQ